MQTILNQLKIKAKVISCHNNGTTLKYELKMLDGERVSKLERYATEIALETKSYCKPIIKVMFEKGTVSVELLINPLKMIKFDQLKQSFDKVKDKYNIPIILGKTHDGEDLIVDLSVMPHLLIAGTTGSGKSVLLHSILNSIMDIDNIKLALIDPKKVELTYYSDIKNLMYPVINDSDSALDILSDLVYEMENRFIKMSKASVSNIKDLNKKYPNSMSYIVLVIDEFSDLMHTSKKEFQTKLCLLAQKSRACGIHIVIATQRPSVDVITGLIKANFPSRISCRVSSVTDSRVILNAVGAERLLGKGDSIISSIGYDMIRFQGSFIDTNEIKIRCDNHKRSMASVIMNSVIGGILNGF